MNAHTIFLVKGLQRILMSFQSSASFVFLSSLTSSTVISFLLHFLIEFNKTTSLANNFRFEMRLNQIRMAQSSVNGPHLDNEMKRERIPSAEPGPRVLNEHKSRNSSRSVRGIKNSAQNNRGKKILVNEMPFLTLK